MITPAEAAAVAAISTAAAERSLIIPAFSRYSGEMISTVSSIAVLMISRLSTRAEAISRMHPSAGLIPRRKPAAITRMKAARCILKLCCVRTAISIPLKANLKLLNLSPRENFFPAGACFLSFGFDKPDYSFK